MCQTKPIILCLNNNYYRLEALPDVPLQVVYLNQVIKNQIHLIQLQIKVSIFFVPELLFMTSIVGCTIEGEEIFNDNYHTKKENDVCTLERCVKSVSNRL